VRGAPRSRRARRTGFSFSRLGPAGDLVASTGGGPRGPGRHAGVDVATEAIQARRQPGAEQHGCCESTTDTSSSLPVKLDPSRCATQPVGRGDDSFQTSGKTGGSDELKYPGPARSPDARRRRVLDAIAHAAGRRATRLVFIDRINDINTTPELGRSRRQSCGEKTLLPFESCTLGSLDVGPVCPPPASATGRGVGTTIRRAVRSRRCNRRQSHRYPR